MFKIGNLELQSHLLLGTGKFENEGIQPKIIEVSEINVLTFAVRHTNLYDRNLSSPLTNVSLKDFIIFPNTAGAKTTQEAIRVVEIASHADICDMIKVEAVSDDETLLPDPFGTYEACKVLLEKGYTTCPHISSDLVLAQRLEKSSVHTVIPLVSPTGTGRGINNPLNLSYIIENAGVPVVVDTGIGSLKDVCHTIELGADDTSLNIAIPTAKDPMKMAETTKLSINTGRLSYEAERIPVKYTAQASSPSEGLRFL